MRHRPSNTTIQHRPTGRGSPVGGRSAAATLVLTAVCFGLTAVLSAGAAVTGTGRSAAVRPGRAGAGTLPAGRVAATRGEARADLAGQSRKSGTLAVGRSATGQVTAHDGQFWLGTQPILLHGIDADPMLGLGENPGSLTDADYALMASWNMNFIRIRMNWGDIEWQAPTLSGTTWTHTYDSVKMSNLIGEIQMATSHGLYVMIESSMNTDHYPNWLWQAPYNSHHIDYPFPDPVPVNTDFWSDALMQQFLGDYLTFITTQFEPLDGLVGIELFDEPDPGTLPLTSNTINTVVNVQYSIAQRVRDADPARVIFFTTIEALGGGIPFVDFTQWKNLGNVAFDLHGYFGGRWGVGIVTDPADPSYGLVNGTLLDDTIMDTTPPYLGTTFDQMRFVDYFQSYLGQPGDAGAIPIVIGEFGGHGEAEPNINAVMGTMTQAFNLRGVAWAVWSYNGDDAVMKLDGTPEPWTSILAAAAAYQG